MFLRLISHLRYMEATMFQLRLFVHQRLYAAGEEILGEVEKTITIALHEAEVSRSKDEAGSLQHLQAHLPEESAAELPVTNGAMEHGDNCDSPLLQENQGPPTPEESDLTVSNSSADLSNKNWNHCLFEMPVVKQEQEQHESETPEIFVSPPEIVKREEDQSSDSSTAVSDDEMVNSKGEEPPKMVKEKKKTLRGKTVPAKKKDQANRSVKGKKGSSFCDLCGKEFLRIASVKKHITQIHKNCTNCGLKCKSSKELLRHLKKKHSNPFVCEVCGKTFFYFRRLLAHKKIHMDTNEFACQECAKTFYNKHHFIVHMRTHSGEKPYPCEICGKSFSQSQNLTIHKRIHSGEKPYPCGECGQLFRISTQRKIHMMHHWGEKACNIYGK